MAQKVVGYIKLQIPAGKATPAPPVGPALGQHGVNIMAFTKEFNERTKNDAGMIIPVIITVYADRSFSFRPERRFSRGCYEHDRGHRPFDGYHRRGVISGFYLLYEAVAICRIQWEGYSSSRLTT